MRKRVTAVYALLGVLQVSEWWVGEEEKERESLERERERKWWWGQALQTTT
jgi:hypothetical protein